MSKVNSELLDQQLKAEAPVAEASCPVSVFVRQEELFACSSAPPAPIWDTFFGIDFPGPLTRLRFPLHTTRKGVVEEIGGH